MLDEIQVFRTEIESVINDISRLRGKTLNDQNIEERIRQIFVTWSRLKSRIESVGVPYTMVTRVDNLLETAARDSGRRIERSRFRDRLRKANKTINDIYLDAVRSLRPVRGQRIFEEIPDLQDNLIPKPLVGWKSKIKEFLRRYPFDQNVFVMVRYADKSASLLARVTEQINAVCDADGKKFVPVVAKDQSITDDLYNPIACLLCCRYGVVIFDTVEKQPDFNPNVAYELGMMHLLGRECLILKNTSINTMPSDFLQKIYMPFSSTDEAAKKVESWFRKRSS